MQSNAMAVTCTLPHRSLLQATKLLPSCHGSALSPGWVFSHYTEHFLSLQELALMVGAAAPGDGVTLQPMGLQQGHISAGLPPAEVQKYQF